MNRLRVIALAAALPSFVACDDPLDLSADAEVADVSAALVSDVLVVHFEVAAPVPLVAAELVAEPLSLPPLSADQLLETALLADFGAHVDGSPATTPAADARWMVHDGRLVLAQGEDIGASWSFGPAALVKVGDPKGDGLFVAKKLLLADALPAELNALVGAEVKVYDREREVCVARISPFANDQHALTAALVQLPDQWDEEGNELTPTYAPDAVFADGLSSLSAGLEPLIGDCSTGLWAMPLAAPKPLLFRVAALAPKLARRAIAAFRATPGWHAAQKSMLEFWSGGESSERREPASDQQLTRPASQRWDTLDGSRPAALAFESTDGSRSIVVVHANSWNGCGSDGQRLTTVFEMLTEDNGKVRFEEIAGIEWGEVPDGIVDLDGDGKIELLHLLGMESRSLGQRIERWNPESKPPVADEEWFDRVQNLDEYAIPDVTDYGCGC